MGMSMKKIIKIHKMIKRVFWIAIVFLTLLTGCTSKPDKAVNTLQGIRYSDGTPVTVSIDSKGTILNVEPIKNKSSEPELYIAPGLIDLQINGYMGVDFTDTTVTGEDIKKVTRALWATGVTQYLPTVITNSDEVLQGCFRKLGQFVEDPLIAPSIPGFHLEGPYLSPVKGFRGAHLAKYIRPANPDEFENYQALSGDKIRLVTVAPEFKGNIPFIEKVAGEGVIVSLGHHNA